MSQHKKTTPTSAPKETGSHPLSTLLHRTCAWYTGISAFVLLFNVLFPANDSGYVRAVNFLLFLPFALALAAGSMVRKADKLSTAVRVLLHPLCVLGGFYLCIYLPYQLDKKPTAAQMLAVFVLVAVAYGIAVGILCALSRRTAQKKSAETPYVSQFGHRS